MFVEYRKKYIVKVITEQGNETHAKKEERRERVKSGIRKKLHFEIGLFTHLLATLTLSFSLVCVLRHLYFTISLYFFG